MLNQSVTPQPSAVSKLSLRKVYFLMIYTLSMARIPNVLKGLNLEINRGERRFHRFDGSGRVPPDILMGLLMPTSGRLLVDGKNLHDSKNFHLIRSCNRQLRVSRYIYLADCSIAENIAFGVPIRANQYRTSSCRSGRYCLLLRTCPQAMKLMLGSVE